MKKLLVRVALIKLLEGQNNISRYILVNLYAIGNRTYFSTTPGADSEFGVYEVSAASYYDDPKTDSMHKQWVPEVFALVQERL